MNISDIKRLLSKSFQNTIKNIVSLGDDSTLESDRKPLKIGGKTTPLEISTDNVYVNGQEIDLKYQYQFYNLGYNATVTDIYFPMAGYIIEGTTATHRNEYQAIVAPYNGSIEKLVFRSEVAQSGDISIKVYEGTDGTEIPATGIFTATTAVDIADDIYQELDLKTPSTGTSNCPLTRGNIYQFKLETPIASADTNITMVFKWDITT